MSAAGFPIQDVADYLRTETLSFSGARCKQCDRNHPSNRTCTEQRGLDAIAASERHRSRWKAETAARLSALVGDEHLYPLLTLRERAHSFRQLAQAVSKLLVKLTRPRGLVGAAERGVSRLGVGCGIGHHSLLALHGLRTRYVTGALLAACQSLQRKSPARQFAEVVRRLSGRGGAA